MSLLSVFSARVIDLVYMQFIDYPTFQQVSFKNQPGNWVLQIKEEIVRLMMEYTLHNFLNGSFGLEMADKWLVSNE